MDEAARWRHTRSTDPAPHSRAQLWLPTNRWVPGEVVAVRYPPIAYLRGERLAVGVASDTGWVPVNDLSAPKVFAPSAGPVAGALTEIAYVAALP